MNEIDIPIQESGPLSSGRIGDIITVTVNVPNIVEVVAHGFNRIVLERSVDAGITWEEVGTPDERAVLEVPKEGYKIRDRHGNGGYQYRTRFLNTRLPVSDSARISGASTWVLGSGIASQQVLTVKNLRERYLWGLRLTDSKGIPLPDEVLQHYIVAAIRQVERDIDVPIIPQTFIDDLDFHRNEWAQFMYVQLDNYPLLAVHSFTLQYPSGQTVVVIPTEWLRINRESGVIQSVPTAGTLSQIFLGQGGDFLPGRFAGGYIPHLMRVEYEAGFGPGQVPADIIELVGKVAALGALGVLSDLIAGAGITSASLSLDGLSQSVGVTPNGYAKRIETYIAEIEKRTKVVRGYYNRVGGMVVA